jgi:hypothetical protein
MSHDGESREYSTVACIKCAVYGTVVLATHTVLSTRFTAPACTSCRLTNVYVQYTARGTRSGHQSPPRFHSSNTASFVQLKTNNHSQDSFRLLHDKVNLVALVDDCGSLNYTSSLVSATSRSLLIKARPDSHRGGWAGTHLSLMSVKLKRASIARRAAVRNRVKIHDGLRSRKSSQFVSHRWVPK